MLPLLVGLAILICLCVDPAKMCLVHPLVAAFGNISLICKELILIHGLGRCDVLFTIYTTLTVKQIFTSNIHKHQKSHSPSIH